MADAPAQTKAEEQGSPLGCLLRLFWMLFGNAIPMFAAIFIAKNRLPWGSIADAVFWAGIVSLVLTRYLDVAYFHGTTSAGEPATLAHWRTHALLAAVIGGILWAGAHGIGMLLTR